MLGPPQPLLPRRVLTVLFTWLWLLMPWFFCLAAGSYLYDGECKDRCLVELPCQCDGQLRSCGHTLILECSVHFCYPGFFVVKQLRTFQLAAEATVLTW